MAASKITVLKRNAPWGPFTREQIEEGIRNGDFTLSYLAHAAGLREWLPLGEVIDFVGRHPHDAPTPLPPVPPRDLPPLPPPGSLRPDAPARPSILPEPPPKAVEKLPPAEKPTEKPVVEKPAAKPPELPEPEVPELDVVPASFFRRGIAFMADCAILFVPVVLLYCGGAIWIEVAGKMHNISHQARMEQWDFLVQSTRSLAVVVALGLGWVYSAGMESSESQATVGKRWLGLKVVDSRGERIYFLQATGRFAAKILSALPAFIGYLMALFSRNNLALHDRISHTRVIRK